MNYIRLLKMATKDLLHDKESNRSFLYDLLEVLDKADEINTKLVGPCKKKVSH